jgi:phosphatidylserine synthase
VVAVFAFWLLFIAISVLHELTVPRMKHISPAPENFLQGIGCICLLARLQRALKA